MIYKFRFSFIKWNKVAVKSQILGSLLAPSRIPECLRVPTKVAKQETTPAIAPQHKLCLINQVGRIKEGPLYYKPVYLFNVLKLRWRWGQIVRNSKFILHKILHD